MNVSAKRLFAIQEERQLQYQSLRKVHLQYESEECSHDFYKQTVSRVTSAFQALSQEMLQLMEVFRAKGIAEVVGILERVQSQEKEKLQLVVKSHIMKHSGPDEEEMYQVKKRLAAVESTISELLQDLKYECEIYLIHQD